MYKGGLTKFDRLKPEYRANSIVKHDPHTPPREIFAKIKVESEAVMLIGFYNELQSAAYFSAIPLSIQALNTNFIEKTVFLLANGSQELQDAVMGFLCEQFRHDDDEFHKLFIEQGIVECLQSIASDLSIMVMCNLAIISTNEFLMHFDPTKNITPELVLSIVTTETFDYAMDFVLRNYQKYSRSQRETCGEIIASLRSKDSDKWDSMVAVFSFIVHDQIKERTLPGMYIGYFARTGLSTDVMLDYISASDVYTVSGAAWILSNSPHLMDERIIRVLMGKLETESITTKIEVLECLCCVDRDSLFKIAIESDCVEKAVELLSDDLDSSDYRTIIEFLLKCFDVADRIQVDVYTDFFDCDGPSLVEEIHGSSEDPELLSCVDRFISEVLE